MSGERERKGEESNNDKSRRCTPNKGSRSSLIIFALFLFFFFYITFNSYLVEGKDGDDSSNLSSSVTNTHITEEMNARGCASVTPIFSRCRTYLP